MEGDKSEISRYPAAQENGDWGTMTLLSEVSKDSNAIVLQLMTSWDLNSSVCSA